MSFSYSVEHCNAGVCVLVGVIFLFLELASIGGEIKLHQDLHKTVFRMNSVDQSLGLVWVGSEFRKRSHLRLELINRERKMYVQCQFTEM